MSAVLIIGAKSALSRELAREFAKEKYDLYLAARNAAASLQDLCADLQLRYGVSSKVLELDVADLGSHAEFFAGLDPKPVGVIFVAGIMPPNNDPALASLTINTNFTGAVSLLNLFAAHFKEQKAGFIIGISSVAGDRGRAQNYIYGASKAGLAAYLSGLRNALHKHGVQVLTVKPGFMQTAMTKDLRLLPALTATPKEAARDIFVAWKAKKDVIYTKKIWRFIMLAIRLLPEAIFKRTNL